MKAIKKTLAKVSRDVISPFDRCVNDPGIMQPGDPFEVYNMTDCELVDIRSYATRLIPAMAPRLRDCEGFIICGNGEGWMGYLFRYARADGIDRIADFSYIPVGFNPDGRTELGSRVIGNVGEFGCLRLCIADDVQDATTNPILMRNAEHSKILMTLILAWMIQNRELDTPDDDEDDLGCDD
jgi:hypothetical protein